MKDEIQVILHQLEELLLNEILKIINDDGAFMLESKLNDLNDDEIYFIDLPSI